MGFIDSGPGVAPDGTVYVRSATTLWALKP